MPSSSSKGSDLFLQTLIQRGVCHIFGNPGTTESGLVDRIASYPEIEYIITLHEGIAVGIADGFAQATRRPAVVNLHVAPGLGNGLGMLFNAWVGRSPLILTAGQQDTHLLLRDPLLAHDLTAMAAPLVKWSVQAQRSDELPLLLHRAFKVAGDPPPGPVFLSLPIDVLDEPCSLKPLPPVDLALQTLPDPPAVERAAAVLLGASNPAIVCGEEIVRSGAQQELTAVAEILGAPVWTTMLQTGVAFPMNHPQFRGELEDNHAAIRARLEGADAIFLAGGDFFREVFYTPVSPFPEGARLVQFEAAPEMLARNFAPEVGVAASLRPALAQLAGRLQSLASPEFRQQAVARRALFAQEKEEAQRQQAALLETLTAQQPMARPVLMAALKRALPEDVIVVGEAITTAPDMFRAFQFERPGDYYGSRGGGIGQGLPGALGVQLAYPNRPVAAISGDGSALFSIQALWTAARYHIPVVFLILNNRSYRILKMNLERYRNFFASRGQQTHQFMDLQQPEIDFVALAQGFGVPAMRAGAPDQVAPAVEAALASGGPYLLDLLVDGSLPE